MKLYNKNMKKLIIAGLALSFLLPVFSFAQQGPGPGGTIIPGVLNQVSPNVQGNTDLPASGDTPSTQNIGNSGGENIGNAGGENVGNSGTGNAQRLENPIKFGSVDALLVALLALVVKIGYIVVVFMVIYVGFLFVVARGNSEKLKAAKTALMWTLIGAVVLLGAQVIAIAVQNTVDAISSSNTTTL